MSIGLCFYSKKKKRYNKWFTAKDNSEMGDYFFTVYGQFVIKKTHSSSGNIVVIALSFSFVTINIIIRH